MAARGPVEVAGVARSRASEWLRSEDELIMLVRPAAAPAPELRHDPGLTSRRATAADAELYARVIGTDSAATFRRRLTDTTHCVLVHLGDELLHASWVTTGAAWTREIAAYLVPPAGDAYVYESFTRPQARGRGVYPFALVPIVRALAGVLVRFAPVRLLHAPLLLIRGLAIRFVPGPTLRCGFPVGPPFRTTPLPLLG